MTDKRRPDGAEPWEEHLRHGLDALSDLGDEQPPNLAGLQMLVVQVQQEQRRQTLRDLALFWLCALLILGALYVVVARQPVYYLVAQGVTAAALAVAMVVHLQDGKRVRGRD